MIAATAGFAATASPSFTQTDMSRIPYYPWCSLWWEQDNEHRSCGFTSYAQCMVSARLEGGMCFENIWGANPPAAGLPAQKPIRRR
jgi:hypothetical protein